MAEDSSSLNHPMRRTSYKKTLQLLLCAAVLVSVVQRAKSGPQADARLTDPQFIAEGSRLFATSCGNAYCHGVEGKGGGAPGLRGKVLVAEDTFRIISTGVANTSMPSFKTELSEEQIWKLVAFIQSDPKTALTNIANRGPAPTSSSVAVKAPETEETYAGNAQTGKSLFFDSARSKSCHSCHSLKGDGNQIGPDLSAAANQSARDLFLSIILPHEVREPKYSRTILVLRNGERIIGVKKEEDQESLRVYDTVELPAVLRTVQKADISTIESTNESVMPKDYASIYTVKQLLDIIAFIKSAQSKPQVTLKDLFQ